MLISTSIVPNSRTCTVGRITLEIEEKSRKFSKKKFRDFSRNFRNFLGKFKKKIWCFPVPKKYAPTVHKNRAEHDQKGKQIVH